MTPELTVLTLAALLQAIQFCLMAIPANLELGPRVTFAPRDQGTPSEKLAEKMGTKTARLHRAMTNHFEALILFTIAVVVVTLSDQSTPFTAGCAWVYLTARILYVPAYAFGLIPWRSLIWGVGFGATTLMLIAALIGGPL